MNEKSKRIKWRVSAYKRHTMHLMSENADFAALKYVFIHKFGLKANES